MEIIRQLLAELKEGIEHLKNDTFVEVRCEAHCPELKDVRTLGLRFQMNTEGQWQLWCFAYFNKTEKIHEGQLASSVKVFDTLEKACAWCTIPSSISEAEETAASVVKDYHDRMWDVENDMLDNSPITCYEVWYWEFSPFDEACIIWSFSTYEEASQAVFNQLKTYDTLPNRLVREFGSFFIYALSPKDQLARQKSVERYNAEIDMKCQLLRETEGEVVPVLVSLFDKAFAWVFNTRKGSYEKFHINDPKFESEIIIEENPEGYHVTANYKLKEDYYFKAERCFLFRSNLGIWLKDTKKMIMESLVEDLCREEEWGKRRIGEPSPYAP